ncbi:CcoQ/FixQ family Cbb3-type cytochrome c oxidase assembly chaperone [Vibrio sp.]|nr:CcoQ/FixQ family Cbb3-type cytochrome c oxidase assembly chaperone [Vibrio sp.]
MDIGTFHALWTLVLFICFMGVVWWAYGSKRRKARFDEAANLVFADEEQETSKNSGVSK